RESARVGCADSARSPAQSAHCPAPDLTARRNPLTTPRCPAPDLTAQRQTSLCSGLLVADVEFRDHRHALTAGAGDFGGTIVTGVAVADDAHARVVGEQAGELLRGEVGAVGHGDLTGVDGAADADAAAMVEGHPSGTR